MRRRRVRRVHGSRRRRAGELVPRAARARGRCAGDDHRRSRRTPSAATRVHRARRCAVRHLHAGDDHGRRGARTEAVDERDARRAGGEPLPLHGLCGHLQVDSRGQSAAILTRARESTLESEGFRAPVEFSAVTRGRESTLEASARGSSRGGGAPRAEKKVSRARGWGPARHEKRPGPTRNKKMTTAL